MKKLFTFLMIMVFAFVAMAQTITLNFTGVYVASRHMLLDRVIVTNLSQNWQETIYWPDTTLVLNNGTGIHDVETHGRASLQLSQNNPNPFTGTTYANLTVAEDGDVAVEITDVSGRVVVAKKFSSQQAGTYQLCVSLSSTGVYFLTARQGKRTASIKMINHGSAGDNTVSLLDFEDGNHVGDAKNNEKSNVTRPWAYGDNLIIMGYSTVCGTEYSQQISWQLLYNETITIGFSVENNCDGNPCPGTATVMDIDNNTYNTVQIGNQCWMKENLRTTRYANGTSIPLGTSTSTITSYRYYPNNNSNNVSTYGYLYNWPAVMQGASGSSFNPSGIQGICPNGWHVPSDAEWTQLTNYVSSQSQYQCNNNSDNIAKALASTTGWNSSPNTCRVGYNPSANNATGFSALPAGIFEFDDYYDFGDYANFWSTTEYLYNSGRPYDRSLGYNSSLVDRDYGFKYYGFSVRCLRDATSSESLPTVTTNAVSNITTTSATCGGNVTSDGGATVIARGVCWSLSQNPTVSNSHTTDGSGMGGFTSSLTALAAGTTYYVRAYATNSQGTVYGSQVSFTTTNSSGNTDGQPCSGAATVTDIDGNSYNTVQIGQQCWMKENLRTTRYANGTSIPLCTSTSTSTTTPYRYNPNDDVNNVPTYGYLYNWPAAMRGASSSSFNPSGVQGICPTGWHVPSEAEWTQLTDYVSSQDAFVCGDTNTNIAKALASIVGWNTSNVDDCGPGNNPGMNNATGFSAIPAGTYNMDHYGLFGDRSSIWSATSTSSSSSGAYHFIISRGNGGVSIFHYSRAFGFSVRCLRD